METAEEQNKWFKIRNNNSEWISDKKAVFVPEWLEEKIRTYTEQRGQKFVFQKGPEGMLWCYAHEIRDMNFRNITVTETLYLIDQISKCMTVPKVDNTPRKLKIEKGKMSKEKSEELLEKYLKSLEEEESGKQDISNL